MVIVGNSAGSSLKYPTLVTTSNSKYSRMPRATMNAHIVVELIKNKTHIVLLKKLSVRIIFGTP
jgi:hypothetical protein